MTKDQVEVDLFEDKDTGVVYISISCDGNMDAITFDNCMSREEAIADALETLESFKSKILELK